MLPDPTTALPDSSKDCFARDKFADYRDDMGGVGSFTRHNRTLYIGRIKETGDGKETEEVVVRHFKEWGPIERVRVLQYRSVAFVTYESELNAQFAKEAMACQSLDNDEILNVRWATEDPNPTTKVLEKRKLEEWGQEAIAKKLQEGVHEEFVDAVRSIKALEDGTVLENEDEDEGQDYTEQPISKRRRLQESAISSEQAPQSSGLLSTDTLEGLRYFAELRKRSSDVSKIVGKPNIIGLIADYGSDDDE
ncbi:hypothetical protein Clacol_002539 [Clathrus columnatus]|uniref:RRM domain-containing protein n=1 Tax=Clathrus columnatus TaxID=1419009 RepID=A0AAV5A4E1_9AGAM|nr:hypothetical protein Clacol_002539 [Clathrus columnatus]